MAGRENAALFRKPTQGAQDAFRSGAYTSDNTWFTGWLGAAVSARSVPAMIVKKLPDLSCRIGANCQLPATTRSVLFANFGVVAIIFSVKKCRTSAAPTVQLPRYARRLSDRVIPSPPGC